MGAYLIYKQRTDPKTGNPTGIELFEVDKNEVEAHRYVNLYNLQRTLDERDVTDYKYMFIEVI